MILLAIIYILKSSLVNNLSKWNQELIMLITLTTFPSGFGTILYILYLACFYLGCKSGRDMMYTGAVTMGCSTYKESQQNACLCGGKKVRIYPDEL